MAKEIIKQIQNAILLFLIIINFLIIYIIPFNIFSSSIEKEIGDSTLNEINKQCSSTLGNLATLIDKNTQIICSKYTKIYYLFLSGFILSIFGIVTTLISNYKNGKKEE